MSTTGKPGKTLFKECRHIKTNGLKCHSPAMRGSAFCYFHARTRVYAAPRRRTREKPLELPPIHGPADVRAALYTILDAVARGDISAKRGGKLLYAIQLAESVPG
jgi:hypothetical protein